MSDGTMQKHGSAPKAQHMAHKKQHEASSVINMGRLTSVRLLAPGATDVQQLAYTAGKNGGYFV